MNAIQRTKGVHVIARKTVSQVTSRSLQKPSDGEIFDALSGVVKTLDTMNMARCTAFDANKVCTASTSVDGVTVLADATRSLFDPERNKTLTTRKGAKGTTRNDGTAIAQVTPIYLILESLSGVDKAFEEAKAADPKNIEVHQRWLSARSQLVDLFLAASGSPTTTYQFDNDGIPKRYRLNLSIFFVHSCSRIAQARSQERNRVHGPKTRW